MSAFQEQEYNKRFDFSLWKKLLYFCKPYKKKFIMLGFFMIGLAGIDVIFPLMSKYAIDHFIIPKNTNGIIPFAIIYVLLITIQTINIFFFIDIAGKIEMYLIYDIRKKSFQHLQELSFNYYDKTPVGWLMARMTSDSSRLGNFISWSMVDLVWGFSLIILISIVMFFLNWKLALIALSVVPILVIISLYFQKKILTAYRKVRKTNSKITGNFNEGIAGAKTTKTMVIETENLKDFQINTTKMYRSSVKAAVFSSLYLPVIISIGSIGTGLVIWFGGNGVMQNTISFGIFVAFLSYTVQFFEPLQELARVFSELQGAQASAERIFSMLDEKPQIQDNSEIIKKFGDILNSKKKNWPEIDGNIFFEDAAFQRRALERVVSRNAKYWN